MALQLKIGADFGDVVKESKAIESAIENVGKSVTSAGAKIYDLDKAFADATSRINQKIDSLVNDALRIGDSIEKSSLESSKSVHSLGNAFASAFDKMKSAQNKVFAPGRGLNDLLGSKLNPALNKFAQGSNQATLALTNLGRVVQDAPFGFLGIANNLNPLLESFQRLKQSTGSTGGALKALGSSLLGAGGLGFAVSAISTGLILFGDKLFSTGKKISEVDIEAAKLTRTLNDLSSGVSDFFSNIDFENKLDKLKNQLAFGDSNKTGLLNLDIDTNQAKENLKTIYSEFAKSSSRIGEIFSNQNFLLDESGKRVINSFVSSLQSGFRIPDEIISELSKKEQLIFNELNAHADRIKALNEEIPKNRRKIAENDIQKQILEAKNVKDINDKRLEDLEKFQNEIISRARAFVKQFGEVFETPDLEESFTNTRDKILAASNKLFDDIENNRLKTKIELIPLIKPGEAPLEGLLLLRKQILESFAKMDIKGEVKKQIIKGIVPGVKEGVAAANAELSKTILGLEKSLAAIVGQGFSDVFSGIGESIGGATDGISNMISIIGDLISAIGKALIAYGVQKTILDTILAGGIAIPGPIAIAAGIAAVAVGQAIKSTKVKGFADGGLVFGPTLGLVGEGFGTSRSNPEVIAPLDQLKNIIGGGVGGSRLVASVTLRGRDQLIQIAREERSQSR